MNIASKMLATLCLISVAGIPHESSAAEGIPRQGCAVKRLSVNQERDHKAFLPSVGCGHNDTGVWTVAQRSEHRPGPEKAGGRFRDCSECPEMIVVPAGVYRMGSPSPGPSRNAAEGPVHRVSIPEPFAVGVYEVTFEQWDACRRAGGCTHDPDDSGWGRGTQPVGNVNWNDAQQYVRWLSDVTGKRYRLPSESEWEYAARGGTTTRYFWGDELGRNRANCESCGSGWDGRQTAPVGSFTANPYGLHDMHGNVSEWVEDCWHDSYAGAPDDGSAWKEGAWTLKGTGHKMAHCAEPVTRGGSYPADAKYLLAASRYRWFHSLRVKNLGFRVARTIDALPAEAPAAKRHPAPSEATTASSSAKPARAPQSGAPGATGGLGPVDEAATRAQTALEPKCVELGDAYTGDNDAACWEVMLSQPNCHAWNTHYHSDRTADWTGPCPGGVAHGRGTFSLTAGSTHTALTGTGSMRNGKAQGRWVLRFANATVNEGHYVDAKRHGSWIIRTANGTVLQGPYVDGKRHGRWVVQFATGSRLEYEFRNSSREGQPGAYVTKDGERHPGTWSDGCFRDANGKVWAQVDSKRRGDCRSENPVTFAKSTLSSNKLGKNAGKAIGQWPAAKKADQNWEWNRIFVFLVQSALAAQGFDPGKPDGIMGPNTMMALTSWHGKGNEHLLEGLIPTVARLLYETLRAVGLSPGPLDEILGSESVAALREWDQVYSSARVASINGVDAVTIKGTITQDLAKSTSPRDKKLVAAQKAPPPRAEKRAPAEGELWGAYSWYYSDRTSGADGYSASWNHPSLREAVKQALKECKKLQPAQHPFGWDNYQCENHMSAFSTSASKKIIPSREAKTYGLLGSIWVTNARCAAIVKSSPNPFPYVNQSFKDYYGNAEEELNTLVKKTKREQNYPLHEIDQIACNDR